MVDFLLVCADIFIEQELFEDYDDILGYTWNHLCRRWENFSENKIDNYYSSRSLGLKHFLLNLNKADLDYVGISFSDRGPDMLTCLTSNHKPSEIKKYIRYLDCSGLRPKWTTNLLDTINHTIKKYDIQKNDIEKIYEYLEKASEKATETDRKFQQLKAIVDNLKELQNLLKNIKTSDIKND